MSTYTEYYKYYYQANKEHIKKTTMEYYAKNKERLQEYRKEYNKLYYQTVLKAKRSKPKTVKPETVKPKRIRTVKHKTITLETVKSEPTEIMKETVLYPTQIVKGNFTLCFD